MSHPSSDKSLEQILSEMDEDTKHDVTKAARAVPRLIAALKKCCEQRKLSNTNSAYVHSKYLEKCDAALVTILKGNTYE